MTYVVNTIEEETEKEEVVKDGQINRKLVHDEDSENEDKTEGVFMCTFIMCNA